LERILLMYLVSWLELILKNRSISVMLVHWQVENQEELKGK